MWDRSIQTSILFWVLFLTTKSLLHTHSVNTFSNWMGCISDMLISRTLFWVVIVSQVTYSGYLPYPRVRVWTPKRTLWADDSQSNRGNPDNFNISRTLICRSGLHVNSSLEWHPNGHSGPMTHDPTAAIQIASLYLIHLFVGKVSTENTT